ncbi:uncharacterized protein LOC134260078, partial [Saccostrea cucullata]|uniref:uncharacterized protein LOC134260078 n=1 Tax=Saccostrea cuccullata TaxID=36930 RepID=UPI002ED0C142
NGHVSLNIFCCLHISFTCNSFTACIGRYGKDCQQKCECGHYGFGCRYRCNCTETQRCDVKIGCVDLLSETTDCKCIKSYQGEIIGALGVTFGLICLAVAGALTRRSKLFYERTLKTNSSVDDKSTDKEEKPLKEQYLTPISNQDKSVKSSGHLPKKQRRTKLDQYQMTEVADESHEYKPLHHPREDATSRPEGNAPGVRHSYEEPKSRYDEIPDYQHLKEHRERKQHQYTSITGSSRSRV